MNKKKIIRKKREKSFFEQLKEGYEDIIAHEQGKIQLEEVVFEISEPRAKYAADKKTRKKISKKQHASKKREKTVFDKQGKLKQKINKIEIPATNKLMKSRKNK